MVQDDMHSHRRRDDTDDTKGHRLEAAAESTFAKLLNRFVMPILFGVVAFFVSDTLKDIRSGQEAQGQAITELKTEFRVLTTRLDEVVIRQVNANSGQLVNHEQRLQALEREGRTQ